MRIITGFLKGKKIPTIDQYRPTTNKVRESIFNIITFIAKDCNILLEADILDLCSGSGSFAFEAISRGAKSATMIDKNPLAIEKAQQFILSNNLSKIVSCRNWDCLKLPYSERKYNLIF